MSEEAIRQIWSRYSKDLSRYTHLVPSSLQFDTPLRHVLKSKYQTKRGNPLSQVDFLLSKATAHWIWTKYSHNFYSGWTTFIHVLSCHYSKFHITIRTTPPPPFAVHSIKLIIDTTQFFPFEGGPSSVRGSHTLNLVQIFKGLVTLYAFSTFQFTIRHTTAPCRIQPVSDKTW